MGRRNQTAKSAQRYLKKTEGTEWKTGIYARLSDENNGFEDDRSLQNQIKYVEEYVKKHPELAPVDCYADNGQSGMSFERAEFKRLMEDVKRGRINCIVVKDLSRFGRNHIEAGYYIEKIFPHLDIRFISINDGFDSMDESNKDGIMMPLKNMINEMYAKDTRRKVLATLRAKEKKGQRAFAAVPYGYRVDPECSYHLIPDEETAGYVRLIFSLRAKGLGTTAIADRLNREKVPTPLEYMKAQGKYKNIKSSKFWNYRGVQKILKNRTYTGATVYNSSGKGEFRVIPDTHEALADIEDFEKINAETEERVRRRAETRKKRAVKAEEFPNILKGLFFCGDCGHAMLYERTGNTKAQRGFRYRCGSYYSYRKGQAGAPPCAVKITSVPEQAVYKFVLDSIREKLREEFFGEASKERQKKINMLKDRERSLKQEMLKLYEDFADRIITKAEYAESRNNLSENMKSIREQLEEAERKESAEPPLAELKKKLKAEGFGCEKTGTLRLTETSAVEVLEEDETDIVESILRRGLTRELAEAMIERMEFNTDGSFKIKFKQTGFVDKPKGE